MIKDFFLWKVIKEHHLDDLPDTNAQFLGVKGIELHRLVKNNIFSTTEISIHNEEKSENSINLFTESEFLQALYL